MLHTESVENISNKRIGSLLFFALLSMAAYIHFAQINVDLFHIINNLGRQVDDLVWISLTTLGNKLFVGTVLFILAFKHPKLLLAILLAAFFEMLISLPLKSFFDAARPTDLLAESSYHLIGVKVSGHSFPSGHTMSAFALAGAVAFYSRNIWLFISMLLLASLSGLSRIMLGVHWPIDVLAGAALGGLCGYIAVFIVRRISLNPSILQWSILIIYSAVSFGLFWMGTHYIEVILLAKAVAIVALVLAFSQLFKLRRAK